MRGHGISIRRRAALAIFIVTLCLTSAAEASEEKLHNFGNGIDGGNPHAGLIFDAAGNLYGITNSGGAYGGGTVFELVPNGSGGWTEKTLYSFGNGTDGAYPVARVIFDAVGNLYGTTYSGGSHGVGTVFELTPSGNGWTEKKLHNFNNNGSNGYAPRAGLIFDAAGNLYGTTTYGGTYNWGTVYQLTSNGSGWTEKKLHNFSYPQNYSDGAGPEADLIFDAAGNLYGTTFEGGSYNAGTVFELMPRGDGSWTEKKLHNFGRGNDGAYPAAGLIFDAAGNLYGTTNHGGTYPCNGSGCGTVFELTPRPDGGWTEKTLYNFGKAAQGTYPLAGLTIDTAGNLYGSTYQGGSWGVGTVFQLTPTGDGHWTETKLHNCGSHPDGDFPEGGVILDAAGNVYGTTTTGGDYGGGTLFEITP